jgi:hypothetical protein
MKIKMMVSLALILAGCATPVANGNRWIKSIGTDQKAGAIERLELGTLPMEWSPSRDGVGWLSLVEPGTNRIVWSVPGQFSIEKHGRSIQVQDGNIIIVAHESGREFEIKIVTQTKYFIKILYRELGGSPSAIKAVSPSDKYSQGILYIKSWIPHPENEKYYKIWVDLFMKANKLADNDMDDHFKLIEVHCPNTSLGAGLLITYSIKKDWFLSDKESSYIPIRIGKDNQAYPSLINRREIGFTKDDLLNNIDALDLKSDKYTSFIQTSSKSPMLFESEDYALYELAKALKVDSLKDNHINHEIIQGQPMLSIAVTINRKENKCRFGQINLISGKTDVRDTRCVIY